MHAMYVDSKCIHKARLCKSGHNSKSIFNHNHDFELKGAIMFNRLKTTCIIVYSEATYYAY